MAVAALAALALGGAVFSQAQSSPSAGPERISATDRDNVQSGNQTTPDKARATSADPAGGGTGQSGDQSTPDTGSTSDPAAERPESGAGSESASTNDGPGGHADEPGNAGAAHQFQGNE